MYQIQQQNYGYQQQPYQVARPNYQSSPMPYSGLKGRPVASLEEARASMIDFDGSVFFFPDLANKRIYTKQINMDGTALLNMYELKEIPPVEPSNTQSNFVTREEFENAINQLRQSLTSLPLAVQAQPIVEPAPAQVVEEYKKEPLKLNF